MKKLIVLAFALSIMIVLAACGDDGQQEDAEQEAQPAATDPVEFTDEEKVEEDSSVADVNGSEITGDKYNALYPQVKMSLQQNGQDVSDQDQIKEFTINMLIEQELIKQAAQEEGIEITEEEVESEFEMMEEQAGEELTTVLDQFQLSEEEFKAQLNDDLITDRYMQENFDVEVTDEEVEEYYEQLVGEAGDEIGQLEDVEGPIRQQLTMSKTQEMLQAEINELKEESDIETLI
ncbi:uncharacterized protein YfbU (UPF0304 family) [Virgibacillus natechei]|uniref:Uncharacterized protein YfbU (UPF0304 family) n=1 Tax=Virgibacillus natechei TaxID=1216297 RepID=A0ABS4IC65_9BACI|nr:SurA N-terminal domain-containing protein [Virgibacillus natechei]MBP1968532.1 uncharacterized protein YfbU (UPF0304 family) [Virgibacillus natechei]UZD13647.1 SurA N-terminal domain-containing protein [Virgibacillus natechei]